MNINNSYKIDRRSFIKKTKIISIFDHDFKHLEADDVFFSQCFLNFENILSFENSNSNINYCKQILNFFIIYIKKHPYICDAFNDSNFYGIIEFFLISQKTSIICSEILSQLIDICSICISIDRPSFFFPLRLVTLIISFIQNDQEHDILKSSLLFLYFLQSYKGNVQEPDYLYDLNALFDQETLLNDILDIEKTIWLQIQHQCSFQNGSIKESADLLDAVYTTLSSFFLIKNINLLQYSFISHSFSPILYQEIYFRIYEALSFLVHYFKTDETNKKIDDFDEIDYSPFVQSILFVLFNLVSYDYDFVSNSPSLAFDEILFELSQIESLSKNNELILEIINQIISVDNEYFNHDYLLQLLKFLLEMNLFQKEEEEDFNESGNNFLEIYDEKIVSLIYEILSKIIKKQFNFQSKVIHIQSYTNFSLIQNDALFIIPLHFITPAIKMMRDTSYSIKIAMSEFISTLFIYGGHSVIKDIICSIDKNNVIIQFFYDFMILNNQLDTDQSKNDWRIIQMKISIKLILEIFSSQEKESYYHFDCLLNDLYEYIYDDELFDFADDCISIPSAI